MSTTFHPSSEIYLTTVVHCTAGWQSTAVLNSTGKNTRIQETINILTCVDSSTNNLKKKKLCKNSKTLPREHLIGCQGVKMLLLKDPLKVFSS